jgi:hypothetical protein
MLASNDLELLTRQVMLDMARRAAARRDLLATIRTPRNRRERRLFLFEVNQPELVRDIRRLRYGGRKARSARRRLAWKHPWMKTALARVTPPQRRPVTA